MSRLFSKGTASSWALGSAVLVLMALFALSGLPAAGRSDESPGAAPTEVPGASGVSLPFVARVLTATPPPVLAHLAAPMPSPVPSPVPTVRPVQRVGIQVGHWLTDEVPEELEPLRTVLGVRIDEWDETELSQQVAEGLAAILAGHGVSVDILPTTVPERYEADLFIALHADAYKDRAMRGFKIARSGWSQTPEADDALVESLIDRYGAASGLPEHRDTLTDSMTEYYAFNHEKFLHSISPSTTGVIIEMGFLTNPEDRRVLVDEQNKLVRSIAEGVLAFLASTP